MPVPLFQALPDKESGNIITVAVKHSPERRTYNWEGIIYMLKELQWKSLTHYRSAVIRKVMGRDLTRIQVEYRTSFPAWGHFLMK